MILVKQETGIAYKGSILLPLTPYSKQLIELLIRIYLLRKPCYSAYQHTNTGGFYGVYRIK